MTIVCNESQPFFGYFMISRPFPVQSSIWLQNVIKYLYVYLTPVCLVIGTFGNFLSIFVFLRPAMSSLASRNRFILISIMDVIILYGCMFVMFLQLGNLHTFCNLELEFFNIWFQTSVIMTDAWILALVTLERTLAIFRPLSTWTNNKNRKRCCSWVNGALIALPFVCFFLCLPELFGPILRASLLASFYYIITNVNTVISTAVPFILMMCLDVAMLFKLYGSPLSGFKQEKDNSRWVSRIKRKAFKRTPRSCPEDLSNVQAADGEDTAPKKIRKTKKARNSHVTANRKSARSRALQSIKMILAVDIVAILLNLPLNMILILKLNNITIIHAARLAVYMRHTINFFFYLISSQFRREAVAVLCCCFRRPVPTAVSAISLSTVTSKVDM